MESFFSRYKNPLVLAFVLAAQFFLLAVQVKRPFPAAAAKVDQTGVYAIRRGVATVVTPPESVLHKGGLSLRDIWSSYLDLIGVREQNQQLKQELEQLRIEQAALAEDARQGERLQDLLAFRQNYINTTVPAQVVGGATTDHSRVLYLDKGSDDGLAVDQPVITPDGIVGRIREVLPRTAQVLEISDPTSAAGVLLEETRTRGILRGNTRGQPQIVNLMPDDRIKPGQLVLTSGGDQIFPRGLPVGVVDHIAPDPDNEPMVDVVLKPAANLNRLEEVLVVTGTAPTLTDRTRRDLAKSGLVAAGARAAQEAASEADAQRASDVLAQRLPSRMDPADLVINPDSSPDASPATSEAEAKPLHPPSPLHPDHYTPTAIPSAGSLTPGQRYAPLVEGTPATERRAAKAGAAGDVNATDTAPVSSNPAFAAASSAMLAQRKAAADAKAAEAAKRYAALHPSAPAAASSTDASASVAAGSGAAGSSAAAANADGTSAKVPATRYIDRANADGTTSRIVAPAGTTAPQYTLRTNADGTITKVPAPALAPRYIDRVNADGTTSRILAPAGTTAPQYTLRTNADGTITKVPVVAAAPRYIDRVNADGTTSRILAPAGTTAPQYTLRTNADGTITKVPVVARAPAAVRYIDRVNPDGTTSRVVAPAGTTAPQYTLRTNADGTTTRVPVAASTSAAAARPVVPSASAAGGTRAPAPAAGGTAAVQRQAGSQPKPATASPGPVTTRVITDGPLPAAGATARPATPRAAGTPAASTGQTTAQKPAPRRKGPELVPDDGSRPPPARPATQPNSSPKPAPAPQGQN